MVKKIEKFWEDKGGMNEEDRSLVRFKINSRLNGDINVVWDASEIGRYVKELKTGKATRRDGIPNEFFKEGGKWSD